MPVDQGQLNGGQQGSGSGLDADQIDGSQPGDLPIDGFDPGNLSSGQFVKFDGSNLVGGTVNTLQADGKTIINNSGVIEAFYPQSQTGYTAGEGSTVNNAYIEVTKSKIVLEEIGFYCAGSTTGVSVDIIDRSDGTVIDSINLRTPTSSAYNNYSIGNKYSASGNIGIQLIDDGGDVAIVETTGDLASENQYLTTWSGPGWSAEVSGSAKKAIDFKVLESW